MRQEGGGERGGGGIRCLTKCYQSWGRLVASNGGRSKASTCKVHIRSLKKKTDALPATVLVGRQKLHRSQVFVFFVSAILRTWLRGRIPGFVRATWCDNSMLVERRLDYKMEIHIYIEIRV